MLGTNYFSGLRAPAYLVGNGCLDGGGIRAGIHFYFSPRFFFSFSGFSPPSSIKVRVERRGGGGKGKMDFFSPPPISLYRKQKMERESGFFTKEEKKL